MGECPPGFFRRELDEQLADEYGRRTDWPAGLDLAAAVMCLLQQQMTPEQFRELLDLAWEPGDDRLEKAVVQHVLPALRTEPHDQTIGMLLDCGRDSQDEVLGLQPSVRRLGS
jgi:uncharacterized protein (DUF2236 family)